MIILGMTRMYSEVVYRLQNKCNAFMSTEEMVDDDDDDAKNNNNNNTSHS
jgi:hypothetical protein